MRSCCCTFVCSTCIFITARSVATNVTLLRRGSPGERRPTEAGAHAAGAEGEVPGAGATLHRPPAPPPTRRWSNRTRQTLVTRSGRLHRRVATCWRSVTRETICVEIARRRTRRRASRVNARGTIAPTDRTRTKTESRTRWSAALVVEVVVVVVGSRGRTGGTRAAGVTARREDTGVAGIAGIGRLRGTKWTPCTSSMVCCPKTRRLSRTPSAIFRSRSSLFLYVSMFVRWCIY